MSQFHILAFTAQRSPEEQDKSEWVYIKKKKRKETKQTIPEPRSDSHGK